MKIWKVDDDGDQVDAKKRVKEDVNAFYIFLDGNISSFFILKSRKIKQIINIWKENCGVVSLHVFQNTIPCEAYTREASMIDSMGIY